MDAAAEARTRRPCGESGGRRLPCAGHNLSAKGVARVPDRRSSQARAGLTLPGSAARAPFAEASQTSTAGDQQQADTRQQSEVGAGERKPRPARRLGGTRGLGGSGRRTLEPLAAAGGLGGTRRRRALRDLGLHVATDAAVALETGFVSERRRRQEQRRS